MKTSFGNLDILLSDSRRPVIEHLIFENKGRPHQHREFESFFVLKGSGKVVSGEIIHKVAPGDLVTIPPMTDHWMEPGESAPLEGFLWYHKEPLNFLN